MEKHRKLIKILFWTILLLGSAALGVCIAHFDLSGQAMWGPALAWLLLMCLGSIIIDLLWYRELGKSLDALAPILNDDPERYMRELEALLADKRSQQLKQVRLINLAAAHCRKEDYPAALELLLQVKPRYVAGLNRAIYWADLAHVYFLLGQAEPACTIMAQQQPSFSRLRQTTQLAPTMAKLDIFQLLAQGQREQATNRLAEARSRFPEAYHQKDFDRLAKLCQT